MNRLPIALLLTATACGGHPHWPDARPADACAAGAFAPGPVVIDVPMPGRMRRAVVWVPRGEGPFDMVVNLHEFRAEPVRQQHYSMWEPMVEAANVMVVGADGKSSTWNAGPCCGKAQEQGIDDVAFLDALVAKLDATACTTGRVMVTGIGNGAMMAERWACESDVPDAVVSVGGSLQVPTCSRTSPIPYLHYHGDADTFVPADGSKGVLEGTLPGQTHRPVSHAIDAWKARNQATAEATEADGELACTVWTGGAPTASCTVHKGADTWPGSANGPVASTHPLANATTGAWAWVLAAWSAPAAPDATPQADPTPAEPAPHAPSAPRPPDP